MRALHGAALCETGVRRRGLRQMRQARVELGPATLPAGLVALPAVLEHRAAVALGRADDAAEIVRWLTDRIGPLDQVAGMRAWAELSVGRGDVATTVAGPVSDGLVTVVIPDPLVDAVLVEAAAAPDRLVPGHRPGATAKTGEPVPAAPAGGSRVEPAGQPGSRRRSWPCSPTCTHRSRCNRSPACWDCRSP